MTDRDLRLDYPSIAPKAVKALVGLNDYSEQCAIDQPFRRLVEILVSEMNGCTYCINVHTEQALALGESKDRVQAVADWRASSLFSDREKAGLAWAEQVTHLTTNAERDEVFKRLAAHFTPTEIIDLTFIATSMNAWNRLAVTMK